MAKPVQIRLSADDAQLVRAQLLKLGEDGEKALKRIEAAAKQPSAELQSLNEITSAGRAEMQRFADRLGPVGAALAKLGPAGLGAAAGLGAYVAATVKGTEIAAAHEQQLNRIGAVLKATGNASGVTAKQIDEFAQRMARATLASDDAVRESAATLATFGNIGPDAFFKTIKAAQDYAATFKTDVQSATVLFGQILDDPVKGLERLTRAHINLSPAQKETIRNLAETGRTAEAQQAILDALAAKVGGAGAAEAAGLAGASHRLKENWEDLLEAFGKTDKIRKAEDAIASFFDALRRGTAPSQKEQIQATLGEMDVLTAGVRGGKSFSTPQGKILTAEQGRSRLAELDQRLAELQAGNAEEQARRSDAAASSVEQAARNAAAARAADIVSIDKLIARLKEEAAAEGLSTHARNAAAEAAQGEAAAAQTLGISVENLRKQYPDEVAKIRNVAEANVTAKESREAHTKAVNEAASAAKQWASEAQAAETAVLAAEGDARAAAAKDRDGDLAQLEKFHAAGLQSEGEYQAARESIVRTYSAKIAKAAADEAKARAAANEAIQLQIQSLAQEAQEAGLSDRERAISTELIKAETAARQANRTVTEAETEAIRTQAGAKFDSGKAAEALKKAQAAADQAVKHSTNRAVDFAADTFDKFLSGERAKWSDFWDDVGAFARKTFAQIAAEALIRPIVMPVMAQMVGGAPSLFGLSGGGAAAGSAGGAGGGSSLTNLSGLTSLFSGLQSKFLGNAFAKGAGWLGLGQETQALFGNAGLNAPYAAIGGLAANMLGLGGNSQLANTLLGGAGGLIGGAFGGPLGAIAGSFLGTAAGGLFGGGKSVGPNASAQLLVSGGRLAVGGSGADNGGDRSGVIAEAKRAADSVNAFLDAFQLSIRDTGFRQIGSGAAAAGLPGSAEEWISQAIGGRAFSSGNATLQTILSHSTATSLDALAQDLQFGKTFDQLTGGASAAAQAVEDLVQQFADMRAQAERLGLPLDKLQAAQAKALGDTETQLRQQIVGYRAQVEGTLGIAGLTQFQSGLALSNLSPLSPADRFAAAKSAYESAAAAAGTGDLTAVGQFPGAAQSYLGEARGFYASSPGYADIFSSVNRTLGDVLARQRAAEESILGTLDMTIKTGTADTIATLKQGFDDLKSGLDAVRAAVKRLGEAA